MKAVITRSSLGKGLILTALIGLGCVRESRANWKDVAVGSAIGGGIGIGAAFICYVACSLKVRSERTAREARARKVDQQIKDIRAWLERLDAYFSTLPIEALRREADEKMAQVRQALAADAGQHRQAFSGDLQQIVHEVSTLRTERDRMSAELSGQRLYLQQVQQFLQSVKDRNGESFLYSVIEARRGVEHAIAQLDAQRVALGAQLAAIEEATRNQQHSVRSNDQSLTTLNRAIADLDAAVIERRVRLDSSINIVHAMEQEVEQASQTLYATRDAHTQVSAEMTTALDDLNTSLGSIRSIRSTLDSQVKDARTYLRQARQQIAALQAAARVEEQDPQPLPSAPPAHLINEQDPAALPNNTAAEDPR